MRKFRSKHIGPLEWFLGVAIERKGHGYHMHQTKYINDLLNRFATGHKLTHTYREAPLSPERFRNLSGPRDDAERERAKRLPYLSLVGALLYLGVMSRPDIMVYLCVLCKHMASPSDAQNTCRSNLPKVRIITGGYSSSNKTVIKLRTTVGYMPTPTVRGELPSQSLATQLSWQEVWFHTPAGYSKLSPTRRVKQSTQRLRCALKN